VPCRARKFFPCPRANFSRSERSGQIPPSAPELNLLISFKKCKFAFTCLLHRDFTPPGAPENSLTADNADYRRYKLKSIKDLKSKPI